MTSLVRLSRPRALLFFLFFRVFLTADPMIGGTSDVSGLIFFCERCRPWSGKLYSSVEKCAQIFSYFISVCTSFSSFFFFFFFFFFLIVLCMFV